jgi:pimeloyl-ACP methyl ester carboxylesterase
MKNLLIFFTLYLSLFCFPAKLDKFTYNVWDKPDLDVYYHLPEIINDETKILFVIHGNSRNADNYLNTWIKLAKDKNYAIFAPHFKRSQFISFNTLQMSTSSGRIRNEANLYLNNSIDLLFDHIKPLFDLSQDSYDIYGHSAGAQFVHRYLLFSNSPKVNRAVAANAGWYTFLDGSNFPYGINNPPIDFNSQNVINFLNMDLHIHIGSADTDISSSVNQSEGANNQGLNRFQRANNFFNYTTKIVEKNDLNYNWSFLVVDGVAHSNSRMSKAAAEVIFAN